MCRPVTCLNCGKTTWAGCGNHIRQVKASVPRGQWCTCSDRERKPAGLMASVLRLFGRS